VSDTVLSRRLAGRIVLITGASDGIGREVALRLSVSGVRLLLVARSDEKLLAVQSEVLARGGQADVFVCDLIDSIQVADLSAQLLALPDGVDAFVSNAGKSIRRSVFDSLNRLHDSQRTMALNYFAPVQLMLSLIPMLLERKGQVLNVSTVNALLIPAPKWAAYQA
jgi:short-subunit dehydrogenase